MHDPDFKKSAAELRQLSSAVETKAAGTSSQRLAAAVAEGAREVAAICDDMAASREKRH